MFAEASTGCTFWATELLSVPTTPMTFASPASAVAAFLPVSGLASSSLASTCRVQPGMAPDSLACLTARSTELRMPRPRADRSPDRGAMTPIVATLPEAWPPEPEPESPPREPHADRANEAAKIVTPTRTAERLSTGTSCEG